MRFRWPVALLLAAFILGLAAPASLAQYTDGLPAGLVQITVDGQPIDASTSPTTSNATPQIAGRVGTATPSLELAIAPKQAAAVRFTVEVDQKGRFKGQPPTPLADGTYSLYVNDALIGAFTVAAGGTPRARGGTADLDLAQVVPFPFDYGDAIPGLGFVDGRFYSLQDEALRTAKTAGDTSPEAVAAAQKSLKAAGWQQRYDARLAVPNSDDPTRFDVQISAFAIAYETPEQADAAFRSVIGNAKPIDAVTIGDTSQLDAIKGTAQNTGADYRGLRVTFRQDRLLVMIVLADLTNKEPDQAVVEAAAQAVQQRAVAVLDGTANGLSPLVQALDLSSSAADVVPSEAYDVLGGALVERYAESNAGRAERVTTFNGTTDAFGASFAASVNQAATGEGADATPNAGAGEPITYQSAVLSFPAAGDAQAWMSGLGDRLSTAPPGYKTFAPVADAPSFGEASATYQVVTDGNPPQSGFRVYARSGTRVVWVELRSTTPVAAAAVGQLARDQLSCLEKGRCNPVPLPALDGSDADRERSQGSTASASGTPTGGGRNRDKNRDQTATPSPDNNGVEVIGG